ncbi:MAG: hypothetical protein HY577_02105 [Candidatus Nealsonbacteria bacterium]|nr:hypothetical protein [Candidatus Nealsonbacteria bacterium]
MFQFFASKEKCPVCKMELEKGKDYPVAGGKKFCSEDCREEYRKKMVKEQPDHSSGGCCH